MWHDIYTSKTKSGAGAFANPGLTTLKSLVFLLPGRLGLFAALHAGALVVLLLPQIREHPRLGAVALESL